VSAGWPRALTAAYAFMALAAGARAAVQIATEFDAAPLAFSLSALSAAVYLLAAVALRREGARWWTLGTAACSVELAGVLAIGTWSLLDPSLPLPRRHGLVGIRRRLRLLPAGAAAPRPAPPVAPPRRRSP
jgi:hypothetical protein